MALKDILAKRLGEAEPPKPLPAGHYIAIVGPVAYGTAGKDNTEVADHMLTIQMPLEDVDPMEIAQLDKGVFGRKQKARFFLTDEAEYRWHEFLKAAGAVEGVEFPVAVESVTGKPIKIRIGHRTYQDSRDQTMKIAADIVGYFPAE